MKQMLQTLFLFKGRTGLFIVLSFHGTFPRILVFLHILLGFSLNKSLDNKQRVGLMPFAALPILTFHSILCD